MDDDEQVVADLKELLTAAIEGASYASDNMRFSYSNPQQLMCVLLLRAIIEYAKSVQLIVNERMYYATSTICRAALDAFIDVRLVCKNKSYCDSLQLADAEVWMRLLEKASAGGNPFLAGLADVERFAEGRRAIRSEIEKFRRDGVTIPSPEERFKEAEMRNYYDSAYKTLSAEAHHNFSFMRTHYFDLSSSSPKLLPRGTRPGSGNPKATLALISQVLVEATEYVLQMCGHRFAAIANARGALEVVSAKYGEPLLGAEAERPDMVKHTG